MHAQVTGHSDNCQFLPPFLPYIPLPAVSAAHRRWRAAVPPGAGLPADPPRQFPGRGDEGLPQPRPAAAGGLLGQGYGRAIHKQRARAGAPKPFKSMQQPK